MKRLLLISVVFAMMLGMCVTAPTYASPKHDKVRVECYNSGHGKKKGHYKHHKNEYKHNHRYVIGNRYRACPHNSVVVRYRNVPYHYGDGYFFVKNNLEFQVVRPPLGLEINYVPDGYYHVNNSRGDFLVYNGVMYKEIKTKKGIRFKVAGFID